MLTTPNFGIPYAEGDDFATDYPATVDEPRALLLDNLIAARGQVIPYNRGRDDSTSGPVSDTDAGAVWRADFILNMAQTAGLAGVSVYTYPVANATIALAPVYQWFPAMLNAQEGMNITGLFSATAAGPMTLGAAINASPATAFTIYTASAAILTRIQ
jgi:hypothetical protein